MNISFNSFLKNSLDFIQQKAPLTPQEKIVVKIAIAIFAGFFAVYFCLKIEYLRQCVTVFNPDGTSYTTHIKNVNGKCKIIFNGYFASQATAEGEFSSGQLNGPGKIIFPSGSVIEEEGDFNKGWLVKGVKVHRSGKVEKGEFNKGYLEGEGTRTFPDGTKESGIFTKGLL